MKRQLACMLALAWVGLGLPVSGDAQETSSGRSSSLFDLGLYGGGAYATDWFASRTASSTGGVVTEMDDRDGHRIGFAPILGANATFYGLPWFGLRIHYGYMPSDLPEGGDGGASGGGGEDKSNFFVNNHFYDLDLVVRLPGIPLFSSLLGNVYGWVGGGGLTTDVAGNGERCVPELLREGACLSFAREHATVGQAVVGLGGDVVSLSANVGIFAELAAHFYDSPVHTGEPFVPPITVRPGEPFRVADDRYAVTPRLVAGVKFAFGERAPVVAAPPMPPPPPPAPAPAPPPPPPPATRDISVCVVTANGLQTVTATFNPANNDTTVSGQRFSARYPATAPTYAAGATWFINTDNIRLNNDEFVKFGTARLISQSGQLRRVGEFQGTPVFAETGATAPYQVLYVPLRPGCEFQPYSPRPRVRG